MRSLPVLLLSLTLSARMAAATPVFLLEAGPGSATISQVDIGTGQLTTLGSVPPVFGDVLGLAAATDNLLYASTASGDVLAITVNPFGVVSRGQVGSSSICGLGYSTSGDLFALDEAADGLLRIDLSSMVATVVGPVRLGPGGPILDLAGGDLAQAPSGTWYLWSNATEALYEIDVATAVATPVDGASTGLGEKTGLAFDYAGGGDLLASSAVLDQLVRLSLATGVPLGAVALSADHVAGDLASPRCTDADGDGFSPEGGPCGPVDCDDAAPAIHPGAAEQCNGRDDDCDTLTDEEPEASARCSSDCTTTAACVAGACETTARSCDDGNPCTTDACVLGLGCQHADQPDGASCSDGNPCNGEERCAGGACMPGTGLDCDDHNDCTVDTCATPDGCANAPIAGCCTTDADCADTSACTTLERCDAGRCRSDPLDCDDHNVCTNDGCDPATGCTNTPVVNGIACGDGNVCNGTETCQDGACQSGTALGCDDDNACTIDGCDFFSGCTHQQVAGCCMVDADCSDTSACTVNERCRNHECVTDPLPCDDQNPCTTDGCDPAQGCRFTAVPNGEACGALDFCQGLETCQAGQCQPGQPPDCDDGNVCTTDSCSPPTGCVHTPVAGCCVTDVDCLDNDPCTTNERCVGTTCHASPMDCDDGNVCTMDSCSSSSGCVHTPVIDGTSCADAAACDGLETCAGGTCQPGSPLDCDDGNPCTADSCDDTIGCRHTTIANCCISDAQCADTDACTVNEHCTAAHVCASTPVSCNDGNVCTVDTCNAAAGCQHPPVASGACNDANACTQNDACVGGTCAGSVRNCSDGNLCNGLETCNPTNGQCPGPGDTMVCTPGSRKSLTCAAEWYADVPNNPKGTLATKKECLQGDASCDHDTDPTTCTFRVGVCFRLSDPRLLRPCTPADVTSYRLLRPDLSSDRTATVALLNALLSVPGASLAPTQPYTISYNPPITQVRCTPDLPIVVQVGRKLKARGKAISTSGVDSDALLLVCRP
ncbi:MAG: putative metal-binding motif-containing protein [Candidatus Binatia bacterium]